MPLPFGSRASRHIAACAAMCVGLGARRSAASELPGVRLDVSRTAGAAGCPDADQLSAELARRIGPHNPADSELLLLSVKLDGGAEAYVATVHVDGRKHGERILRAAGPTCDSLHDALLVTLLVLLDEERAPAREAPASAQTAPAGAAPAGADSALTTVAVAPREQPAATPLLKLTLSSATVRSATRVLCFRLRSGRISTLDLDPVYPASASIHSNRCTS